MILDGKDLFAQAQTGSGKTGAFAIPVLEQILRNDTDDIYIVLSPTRELAQQTNKVFTELGDSLGIKSVCVIGGESFDQQKQKLSEKFKIIVGTPGRICDLIKQKIIISKKCNCVIFDEADRLFEMGFSKDNEFVLRNVKPERQLIMVSATNNQEIFRTAYKFRSHPEEIKLNEDSLTVDSINQKVAMLSEEEKMPYLVNLLRQNKDSYALVFCNTQYMTALVALWLEKMDFKVKAISGNLPQNKRTKLLQDFRDKKITTLVCTDVAARGLDIKDVNLVVNYDFPNEAANYVHRIGRTGRAGKDGLAVGFCGHNDYENFDAVLEFIDMKIPKVDIDDSDFAKDIVKRPRIDSKTLKPYDDKRQSSKDRESYKDKDKMSKNTMSPKIEKNDTASQKEVKTYERFFEVQSYSFNEALNKAQKYFAVNDKELLNYKILTKGKKKFFFFGPQNTQYQFCVKPLYKKILLPFLINLFKKMDLRVYVNIFEKNKNISITFSGKDAGQLLKNKFAIHNSVKEITLSYLRYKMPMTSDLSFNFKTETGEQRERGFHRDRKSSSHRDKVSEIEIKKLVDQLMKEVEDKNEPILTQELNSAQRRLVHIYIRKNAPNYESSSVGEGRLKKVKISKKLH